MTNNSLPAGDFSAWLHQFRNALRGQTGMDVPCGECVGCCQSSYFIHIKPGEEALSHLPETVLFPAPALPVGHFLLGYDEQGRCPMLQNGNCAVYAHRPQTCRDYDCRVFAAAGIEAGGEDKTIINQRVRLWKFTYPAETDRTEHRAVRDAARFMRTHTDCFPDGRVPDNPSQLALLAIQSYSVFLPEQNWRSNTECARAIVETCRTFYDSTPI